MLGLNKPIALVTGILNPLLGSPVSPTGPNEYQTDSSPGNPDKTP